MTNKLVIAVAASLLSVSSVYAAVPEIKPGLWEVTAKWDVPTPDVSKMSAEEKDRFEKGKAEREERIKQAQQPRPVCITGEMVSKGHWFGGGRRATECEFSNVKTTAKQVNYDVACSGGPRNSVGKGKLTMVNAQKFSGETISQSAGPAGSAAPAPSNAATTPARTIKITTSGTWKAADCGATTPTYPNVKK